MRHSERCCDSSWYPGFVHIFLGSDLGRRMHIPRRDDPLKKCFCDKCGLWSVTEMLLLFDRTVVKQKTILDAFSISFIVDASSLASCWRLRVACWDFRKLEHDCVELEGKSLTDLVKSTEQSVPGAAFLLYCRLVVGIEHGCFTADTEAHGCLSNSTSLFFNVLQSQQELGLSPVADLPLDLLQKVALRGKLS